MKKGGKTMFVIKKEQKVQIYLSENSAEGVRIAAKNLCKDLEKICAVYPVLTEEKEEADIVIETVDKAGDCCEPEKEMLIGKDGILIWEAYCIRVKENKLYITGAGRRGVIYGIYEFSRLQGVSPWYWFADVPLKKKELISLEENFCIFDYPSVKYRGIFINDEEELEAWAIRYMHEATIGPKTYEKIFELLLRLRANYIWPAMHVNAFHMNPQNAILADRMGIVIGTSHCDMLLRSNQNEWKPWLKQKGYCAKYDYSIEGKNREIIKEYWRESVRKNKEYEVCFTIGMRGIHDSGFVTEEIDKLKCSEEEKVQNKIQLLEKIMKEQQEIILEETGKTVMQTFIPYKEVLSLYDKGLKVPDNVTLIWANDNFGYMRRYPDEKEQKRLGGNGLYYHASYWAHPGMSYLFFNSTPLSHMKNELKKSYENGIRRLWVLNAGAMKPLEIDIEFFLSYAWEIGRKETTTKNVRDFLVHWFICNFEAKNLTELAQEAAEIYMTFSQITNVRKVEHMTSNAFSQTAYGNEAAYRMNRYQDIFYRTVLLQQKLEKPQQEAFFQMFAMKIYAAYFINASFYFADRSILMYEKDKMAQAEQYTLYSRQMDEYKRRVIYYYNKILSKGKWDKIVTPECFLPPCTALYPACKPALVLEEWPENFEAGFEREKEEKNHIYKSETGYSENDGYICVIMSHFEKNSGWNEIKDIGFFEGNAMEAGEGILEYEINTVTQGSFLLELYRFPTLNARGKIRVGIRVDNGELLILESKATDEWRDTWKQNVINNVEKLYIKLPYINAGKHSISIYSVDKYFLCTKFVIYTKSFTASNLGPQESYHSFYYSNYSAYQQTQKLYSKNSEQEDCYTYRENMEELDRLCERIFCCKEAPLPDVIYADREFWKKERLYLKNSVCEQKKLGYEKYALKNGKKDVFSVFGKGVFQECNGIIAFGSEYVLEQSEYAYLTAGKITMEGITEEKTALERITPEGAALKVSGSERNEHIFWEHTQSETDGRTGIAMYIAKPELFWKDRRKAPAMHYKINCSGGTYLLWLLIKYDDEPAACCTIAIDDKEILQEEMFGNGHLFNYGTQQNWVWMSITEMTLTKGEHLFSIYARASQLRIDRIYITKTDELPPVDEFWKESLRSI